MDRQRSSRDVVDARPDEERSNEESSGLPGVVGFVAAVTSLGLGYFLARSSSQDPVTHRPHVAYQGNVVRSRPEPPPPSAPVTRAESAPPSAPVTRAESAPPSAPVTRAESAPPSAPVTRVEPAPLSIPGTVIHRDAEKYKMNHKWRGEAHIFYHKTFEMKRRPRNGTEDDRDKLVLTFQNLNFNVKCHNDLSLSEIEGILRDVAARDHTDCDCLVVAVLTHCGLDKLLVARDEEYDISTLLNPFIGSRSRGLATKPKLFFIQTCKGEYGDLQGRGPRRGDSIDGVPDLAPLKTYQVPSHADILIWYAPFDEQYDRTRYKEPSCVRCLHSVFAKRDTSLHLVSLLTDVTRQFGELGNRRGERVPCFTTSLTRLLYFP